MGLSISRLDQRVAWRPATARACRSWSSRLGQGKLCRPHGNRPDLKPAVHRSKLGPRLHRRYDPATGPASRVVLLRPILRLHPWHVRLRQSAEFDPADPRPVHRNDCSAVNRGSVPPLATYGDLQSRSFSRLPLLARLRDQSRIVTAEAYATSGRFDVCGVPLPAKPPSRKSLLFEMPSHSEPDPGLAVSESHPAIARTGGVKFKKLAPTGLAASIG